MDHDIRYLLDRGEDGDDEEALRLIETMLASSGGDAELLVLKAEALRNLELYEEAVKTARSATHARESAGFTHQALGEALLDLADETGDRAHLEAAREAFQAATERGEDLWMAQYWLAESEVRLGNVRAAMDALPTLARRSDWDPVYVTRLARLIADGHAPTPPENRPPTAAHPDESLLLGIALREAGKADAALVEFGLEADLDPLTPESDYQCALAHLARGDADAARRRLAWPCETKGFFEATALHAALLVSEGKLAEGKTRAEEALAEARRWSENGAVERIERGLLELSTGNGADAFLPPPLPVADQLADALMREKRLAVAHPDPRAQSAQMASVTSLRFDAAGRTPVAAWRIAVTCRAHAHPDLASDAWDAARNQCGDSLNAVTSRELQAVAGLVCASSWYATCDEFEGKDYAPLAVAAAELLRRAVEERQARGAAPDLPERGHQVLALTSGDPVRLDREDALRVVGAVLGPLDGKGLLHTVAGSRVRR